MSIRVQWAKTRARVNRKRITWVAGGRSKEVAERFLHSLPDEHWVTLRANRIRLKVKEIAINEIETELRKHPFGSKLYSNLSGKLSRIKGETFPYTLRIPRLTYELCLAASKYALFGSRIGRVSRVHPFERNKEYESLQRILTGKAATKNATAPSGQRFQFLSKATVLIAQEVGARKAKQIVQNFDLALVMLEGQLRRQGFMKDPLPRSARVP